jgi:hypothetical protein
MVIKHGYAPGLIAGRLNTNRSFTEVHFKGQPPSGVKGSRLLASRL